MSYADKACQLCIFSPQFERNVSIQNDHPTVALRCMPAYCFFPDLAKTLIVWYFNEVQKVKVDHHTNDFNIGRMPKPGLFPQL